jgi:AAA15 family ATPase/GTPase
MQQGISPLQDVGFSNRQTGFKVPTKQHQPFSMLIDFRLKNFRSVAEKQRLSLVAGVSAKRRKQHSFASGNSVAPHLLRSICLFGPNGAGKSTFVQAFDFVRNFVVSSAKDKQEGEPIDVESHRLDPAATGEPSEFEITFIHEDFLYEYGFSVDKERVWDEWLFAKPSSPRTRMRELFQRNFNSQSGVYEWSINENYVKGVRKIWETSTRDNALFLSTAVQLKSESLRPPFQWIQKHLRVIESPERLTKTFTTMKCLEGDSKNDILKFVQAADLKIQDFEVEARDFDVNDLRFDIFSDSTREALLKTIGNSKNYLVNAIHKGRDGRPVKISLEDESDGSRVLYSLAGPWLDVLQNGYTIVIDELHNSLHPHALKFLVGMFHDPKINVKNAQLIFTSHETSVMAKGCMHRDQIWLIEKDENDASHLYPLSDFRVREIDAFQKAYLDGRFGALPKIGIISDV